MDYSKAFSADNGFIVDEDNGGPFYTGGTASPVGQGLPANTVYTQTVAGGILLWQKYGAGDTSADWRLYPASGVSFIDTNSVYKPGIDTAQKALDELRNTRVSKLNIITTTLNGTFTSTIDSTTLNVISGTATGYTFKLPNATTLSLGREFEIFNDSSESVDVDTGDGSFLFKLNPNDIARMVLVTNGTSAGVWTSDINSASATGILSFSVGSTTTFTTSSAADVLITGMAVTPDSGRYACYYSSDISISNNNRKTEVVFFAGGSAIERSRRRVQGVGSGFLSSHNMVAEITVNGAQAIDVRVNVDSGDVNTFSRRMFLIRLGT